MSIDIADQSFLVSIHPSDASLEKSHVNIPANHANTAVMPARNHDFLKTVLTTFIPVVTFFHQREILEIHGIGLFSQVVCNIARFSPSSESHLRKKLLTSLLSSKTSRNIL